MQKLLKALSVFSLILIFVLGTGNIVFAQTTIAQAPIIGKYTHAGAVQIELDPTGAEACPLIKADTYLTLVNPAELMLLPCADITLRCYWLEAYISVYNSEGIPLAKKKITVPPKGNATVSLTRLILQNDTFKPDGVVRKYTYDIIWKYPCISTTISQSNCIMPFLPITVEVKEVIFSDWLCSDVISEDVTDMLLINTDGVKTMSETILNRCNVTFAIKSIEQAPVE